MKVGLNVQIYFLAFVDTVRFPLRLGGVVAQLVERIVRNDKVVGSIPINSTRSTKTGFLREYVSALMSWKIARALCVYSAFKWKADFRCSV